MMETERYTELLIEIRDHLCRYGDRRWPQVLDDWIGELREASGSPSDLVAHLERSRRAVSGMGSLGDIVIYPESGHAIESDEREIQRANSGLRQLVHDLDREVARLLRGK